MMTAVAIIGVLTTAAGLLIKPSEYAKSARGFTDRVAAILDMARERAVASRRFQRIEISSTLIQHFQATTTGLGTPVAYQELNSLYPPSGVSVDAYDASAHLQDGVSVPSAGSGLPAIIDFSPDGTAQGNSTVFIGDSELTHKARVVLYGASGTVVVYDGW
jgi:hypothetical protein